MSKQCMSTEEFVHRAKTVHGDKYDYSNCLYEKYDKHVEIVCKKHGSFFQQPQVHLRGVGCEKCAVEAQTMTLDCFRDKASLIHQNKYDYSKSVYKNLKEPIEIICPIHGSFFKSPQIHIHRKVGCPNCSPRPSINTASFISRATETHQNLYDYSKVMYVNDTTKVEIICKEHGSFFQSPGHHVGKKQGCPVCKHEKARMRGVGGYNLETIPEGQTGMFYCVILKSEHEEYIKIGITKNTPQQRLRNYGAKITILETRSGLLKDMYIVEQHILEQLKDIRFQYRPKNKYARTHGWTESFNIKHKPTILLEVLRSVDSVNLT